MLRKLASALAVAFAVTLATASTATAAPYDPATVGATRGADGSIDILGANFGQDTADDFVTVTVLINGVSTSYQFELDDEGNFDADIPGLGEDDALITIVGNRSGETRSALVAGVGRTQEPTVTTTAEVTTTVLVPTTVAVPTTVNGVPSTAYVPSTVTSVAVIGGSGGYSGGSSGGTGSGSGSGSGSSGGGYYSSDGSGSSAGVGGSYYSADGSGSSAGTGSSGGTGYSSGTGSSGGSVQGAYGSDYAATGAYGSGLANTGASIAGPMAIGIGTLTVGLGLLFFGTRGVIRRKGARGMTSN